MTTLRLVTGDGPCAPALITAMAVRIIEYACNQGWRLRRLQCSRVHDSDSRYIHLADAKGRPWTVRVSNHHRPRRAISDAPHFDLVSRDGASGFDTVRGWIDQAKQGDLAWWDNADTGARKPARKRRAKR